MKVIAIASVASFAAAFAAASWVYRADDGPEAPAATTEFSSSFDAGLPVEERVTALERAVSDERFARQLLQEELFYLTAELEHIAGSYDAEAPDETDAEQADAESGDPGLTGTRSKAGWSG
jgi:hypothetical protein